MAATEVIVENCEGSVGSIEEIGEDVFAFVPDDALAEFAWGPDMALSDEQRDEAVASCVDSDYADRYARSVVGDDASRQALEQARRQVCEALFS